MRRSFASVCPETLPKLKLQRRTRYEAKETKENTYTNIGASSFTRHASSASVFSTSYQRRMPRNLFLGLGSPTAWKAAVRPSVCLSVCVATCVLFFYMFRYLSSSYCIHMSLSVARLLLVFVCIVQPPWSVCVSVYLSISLILCRSPVQPHPPLPLVCIAFSLYSCCSISPVRSYSTSTCLTLSLLAFLLPEN